MSDVNWGNYAEAYKTIHDKLNEILAKLDYPADPAVQDVIDRADRVLGRVYGSQGQQLKQRASTHELMVQLVHQGVEYQAGGGGGGSGLVQCQILNEVGDAWINEPFARRVQGSQGQDLLQRAATYDMLVQLRHAGTEIDPRQIRALTSSDVVDVSDRSARDLGHLDIDNFPSEYPLPSTQVSDLKNVTVVSALPAGNNNIGDIDVVSMPNVVQAEKDRTITDISKVVTQKIINLTATGVIHTPASGKKIRLKAFAWSSSADIVTALRFGTGGDLLFAIQAKGVIGMNLVGCNIEGAVNEALYGYLSGSGTMRGTVLLEEI
jgi:hypothetical protein